MNHTPTGPSRHEAAALYDEIDPLRARPESVLVSATLLLFWAWAMSALIAAYQPTPAPGSFSAAWRASHGPLPLPRGIVPHELLTPREQELVERWCQDPASEARTVDNGVALFVGPHGRPRQLVQVRFGLRQGLWLEIAGHEIRRWGRFASGIRVAGDWVDHPRLQARFGWAPDNDLARTTQSHWQGWCLR